MKEGCLGVPSPAAADESSAAASVKQCPWMRVKQYLSTLESQLCPAAKYQRTLERNDWRRHHTADSLGYCALGLRFGLRVTVDLDTLAKSWTRPVYFCGVCMPSYINLACKDF